MPPPGDMEEEVLLRTLFLRSKFLCLTSSSTSSYNDHGNIAQVIQGHDFDSFSCPLFILQQVQGHLEVINLITTPP